VQVGQACPDQPYQAVLTVNSPQGGKIVQVQADKDGRFKIPLAPGEYVLHPESPNTMPFAREQSFVVEQGKFTQTVVNYDSGIR
jgi:major membrane immunogen (membrane-anchored lipoprotein)